MKLKLFVFAISVAILGSCVPARQLEELKVKQKRCEDQNEKMRAENIDLNGKVDEFTVQVAEFTKQVQNLEKDTTITGSTLRRLTSNYDKLNQTYELLLDKNKELLAGNAADNRKLVGQLQSTQEDLQRREDDLRKLEKALAEREGRLDRLTADNDLTEKKLQVSQAELLKRESKIKEMEAILSRKDSVAKALRDKVSEALLGFQNNGLTVEMKNGKVYVSLEERLLFASGKWEVDTKGQEALKKLAKAIESQDGLNIQIEGHTDNVPYNGATGIKDNWDLSVVRATSIVKILLANSKLNPKQLTAAGRGEFVPLDPENTPEARKKNRRTEIIISPKLDELLQILETN